MDGPLTSPARQGPVVVKLGGALIDDPPQEHDALFEALASLFYAHPTGVIIVHGGGKAVDRQLDRLGMTSERREGIRITPPDQLEQIVGVLAGSMNTRLVGTFTARNVPAVGLTLSDGLLARVEQCTQLAFDPGRVGEVIGGSAALLRTLLAGGFLPVLSSIGIDPQGEALNVNADLAAASIAAIAGASSLRFLTDVPGVLGADGRLVSTLDSREAEELISQGVITGGMIVKVRGAVEAAERSGVPVVISSWKDAESIKALAKGALGGTTIQPRSEVTLS